MIPPGFRALIALATFGYLLYRSLPGAILCVFPGLMAQRAVPSDEQPEGASTPLEDAPALQAAAAELRALGFARLGIRQERSPLGPATLSYDFFHPGERCYASVSLAGRTRSRLYFFTPYDGGAAVLTADHRRPGAVRDGYYLAGGLKGHTPDQLWAAHRRQMAAMEETGRERVATPSLSARIDAARAWFTGVGKREVRVRNATALFVAILALFVLYSALASLPWAHLRAAFRAPAAGAR